MSWHDLFSWETGFFFELGALVSMIKSDIDDRKRKRK